MTLLLIGFVSGWIITTLYFGIWRTPSVSYLEKQTAIFSIIRDDMSKAAQADLDQKIAKLDKELL